MPEDRPENESMNATRWSRVGEKDYAYLVSKFWDPVQRYLAAQLPSPDDADDLTQELFLRFIDKDLLQRADPLRGSFRSFLFQCVRNFLKNHYRGRAALKRGGDVRHVGLEALPLEPAGKTATPQQQFDRAWCLGLLQQARQEVKSVCERRGRPMMYRAFRLFYFGGDRPEPMGQKEIAAALGLSVTQTNNYVHRSRALFSEKLRALVSEYTSDGEEAAAELSEMARCIEREQLLSIPGSTVVEP